jgi:CheY-like chemotaxis protein
VRAEKGWPRNVIVADDDASHQSVIRELVETCGHNVFSFDDWRAALDALSSGRAERLILNFYMGTRRSAGQALLQALRSAGVEIPTIITAPRDDRNVAAFCSGFPFVKYFLDPTDLYSHYSQVQEILSSPPVSGPFRRAGIVFVVHGEDTYRQRVFGLLQKLGVTPIYLHGEPVVGKTIIQALEEHARNAEYAVCVFSDDDVGYRRGSPRKKCARARQNVVLETGLFIGAIGRSRVMILHGDNIERPSDLDGVLYVPLKISDDQLLQRFIQAFSELSIDYRLTV